MQGSVRADRIRVAADGRGDGRSREGPSPSITLGHGEDVPFDRSTLFDLRPSIPEAEPVRSVISYVFRSNQYVLHEKVTRGDVSRRIAGLERRPPVSGGRLTSVFPNGFRGSIRSGSRRGRETAFRPVRLVSQRSPREIGTTATATDRNSWQSALEPGSALWGVRHWTRNSTRTIRDRFRQSGYLDDPNALAAIGGG